jgi:sensor histidine kinase YesM
MTVCAAYAALFYRRFHERDASLNKARLDALRHQLQPHFLFNTLNVIASLVHEDPRRADAMLTALADLLRFTLETSGDQVVPLHRETAFIGRYLALMNARFEDRLRYSIEITPETYSALVPVLLLQPIVENAIEHGIQQKPDGGSVSIRAFLQLGKLHIEIVDDGVGIPEGHDIRMGIGIRNTIGRLEERYGKNAKLRITSPPGTKVEIIIPHRPA